MLPLELVEFITETKITWGKLWTCSHSAYWFLFTSHQPCTKIHCNLSVKALTFSELHYRILCVTFRHNHPSFFLSPPSFSSSHMHKHTLCFLATCKRGEECWSALVSQKAAASSTHTDSLSSWTHHLAIGHGGVPFDATSAIQVKATFHTSRHLYVCWHWKVWG